MTDEQGGNGYTRGGIADSASVEVPTMARVTFHIEAIEGDRVRVKAMWAYKVNAGGTEVPLETVQRFVWRETETMAIDGDIPASLIFRAG